MGTSAKIIFFAFLQIVLSSIYIQSLNAQLVSDFRVNDDTTNYAQFSAKMGIDQLGNFTVVWRDLWNTRSNVRAQRFNINGNFLGINFTINSNPDSSLLPNIAVTKNGTFCISWLEVNSSIQNSSKMKCRLFNRNGIPYTGEIILNDSIGNFFSLSSIGVNQNNEFIVSWNQNGILYQRVDSVGTKIGFNIKVNDNIVFAGQGDPAITVRTDGSYIITWHDTRPPAGVDSDDIYFQMFDRFGNRIGANQKVNDDASNFNLQLSPKISTDTSGRFVIAWNDDRLNNSHSEVYAQMFESNGSKTGVNFRITQSSTNFGKGICNVFKKPNGDFVVGWSEFRPFIPQPYFQRYSHSGSQIGNNYLVTNETPTSEKYYSDFQIFGDKIISIWDDARNDPFDIYCNIRSFTNPDTTVNIIQTSSSIPVNFLMHQNYPNPFNSSTIIEFEIKQRDNYKLEIANSLGQVVQILFQRNFYYGTYQFNLDATNLSSGMYYSILSSKKERIVKSFVILK